MTTPTLAFPACPEFCDEHSDGRIDVRADGRLDVLPSFHQRTLAVVPAVSPTAGGPADVRLSIERHDDPLQRFDTPTAVTLEVARRDTPNPLTLDVAALTGGLSDRQCRLMAAQVLAGCEDRVFAELTAVDLLALSAAAAHAAVLLAAESKSEVAA